MKNKQKFNLEVLSTLILARKKTFIREYLREVSAKIRNEPIKILRSPGKIIHEKTWSGKSRVRLYLK